MQVFVQVLCTNFQVARVLFQSIEKFPLPILSRVTFAPRYFRYFSYFSTFGAVPTDRWRYLANCFFRFPGIDKSGNDQSYRVLQWIPRKAQQKTRYAMDEKKKEKKREKIKEELGGKKKKMSMRRKREMVEHFDDDVELQQPFEYFTIPRSVSVC